MSDGARRSPSGRSSLRALALALAGATLGCVSENTLAARLAAAAQPGHLPQVVACWEKEVEAAGFVDEYVVTADLVVEGGSSRVKDARVTAVEPADSRGESLGRCVEEALNRSALPREDDREGPGFAAAGDVAVRGYRFAFLGPSREERERAAARQAHVLLGPRADRCQGLYAYDPPRDAPRLFAEAAEREQRAGSAAGDADAEARALQQLYDIQLELRARLRLDADEPGLPAANRKRTLEALREVEAEAKKTGARIRCEPAPLR